MRNLTKVISEMLHYIPDSESELKADLRRIARDSAYTAPEVRGQDWIYLARRFNAHTEGMSSDTIPDWWHVAGKIMAGK